MTAPRYKLKKEARVSIHPGLLCFLLHSEHPGGSYRHCHQKLLFMSVFLA